MQKKTPTLKILRMTSSNQKSTIPQHNINSNNKLPINSLLQKLKRNCRDNKSNDETKPQCNELKTLKTNNVFELHIRNNASNNVHNLQCTSNATQPKTQTYYTNAIKQHQPDSKTKNNKHPGTIEYRNTLTINKTVKMQ